MNTILGLIKAIPRRPHILFWCGIWILSLVISKFLLSVSMWALVIIGLCNLDWSREGRFPVPYFRWLKGEMDWRDFFRARVWWVVTALFWITVVSLLWSDDFGWSLSRFRIRIPFLVIPVGFYFLPSFSKREVKGLLLFYMLLMTATAVICLVNYGLHFEAINISMGMGKHVPVPLDHIRFSFQLAFCTVAGLVLLLDKQMQVSLFKSGWLERYSGFGERGWTRLMAFVLFVSLHVFSVKSGLIALYLCLLFGIGVYMVQYRRWFLGILVGCCVFLLPFFAYKYIPSFTKKVNYTVWDWQQFREGVGSKYSDSERIASVLVGWTVFKSSPWLGVGAGDLPHAMDPEYDARFPGLAHKTPHNQYIVIAASTGLIGFLIFAFAFFFPLGIARYRRFNLFVLLHIIVFFSFLMEDTLEIALGTAFYLFWLCLFMKVEEPL
jgi:O-antigen ligase